MKFIHCYPLILSSLILLPPLAGSAVKEGPAHHSPYNNASQGKLCWPTQYSYENNQEVISDYKNKRILYRAEGESWKTSPLALSGAHSVRYSRHHGYIIDDTEANRIIQADSLSKKPKRIDQKSTEYG
ncbi:hypothetical protein [Pseudomonas cichorii]|uniref:hypothetical protein n=1 Tax=Pseudomonas cichorii TaxID=36746 RepID=UPI00190FFF6B|nr:hypothetical protein [Pseudomonas cichorii]